jgi:enoyl-CoA hydratase/carnithine racemase
LPATRPLAGRVVLVTGGDRAGLAAELDASERVFASGDMLEGARAFFEKRPPDFKGA